MFEAWTSPEVMRRWLHCDPDWDTPFAEVALRVGGCLDELERLISAR